MPAEKNCLLQSVTPQAHHPPLRSTFPFPSRLTRMAAPEGLWGQPLGAFIPDLFLRALLPQVIYFAQVNCDIMALDPKSPG